MVARKDKTTLAMVGHKEKLTLTVEEAAELLGIGRSLAYEMVRTGKIPALRLGGKWLISRSRLKAMVDGPTPEGSE